MKDGQSMDLMEAIRTTETWDGPLSNVLMAISDAIEAAVDSSSRISASALRDDLRTLAMGQLAAVSMTLEIASKCPLPKRSGGEDG